MDERKKYSEKIAQEIVNVQPIGPEVAEAIYTLFQRANSEKQLREEGYRPVSRLGLMWIKGDTE